jgi:hypothetical protein
MITPVRQRRTSSTQSCTGHMKFFTLTSNKPRSSHGWLVRNQLKPSSQTIWLPLTTATASPVDSPWISRILSRTDSRTAFGIPVDVPSSRAAARPIDGTRLAKDADAIARTTSRRLLNRLTSCSPMALVDQLASAIVTHA